MFDRIEAFITAELKSRRIPGAAIAVVRDGHVEWSRGFGVASLNAPEPMTPATVFPVQSLSKVVTASAVMQLRDAERLSLDDAANGHMGAARIRNEWEAESPVTVRQLLTHTSGLPCDVDAATPQLDRSVPLSEFVNSVAKTVRRPGSEIVYANWGYDALGPLIDHLTAGSWEDLVSNEVFGPLGMNSSRIGEPIEGAATAAGHFLSAVDGELHSMRPMWPLQLRDTSGSICSTVEDVGRFLAAHLGGGSPIHSPETAAEMQRLQAGEGVPWSGMGLGWRVTRSNGRKLICHGGDGAGFTNFMGGYPDLGVGIVLTLNRGGVANARSVIANTVLGMLAGEGARPAPGPETDLKPFEGAYRSTYWDITADLTLEGAKATMTITDGLVATDAGEPSNLRPPAEYGYRAEGGMFHGFDVALLESEDGPAVSGGLYPFTFRRTGEITAKAELMPDVGADLNGLWRGTARTPLGPIMLEITVSNAAALVSTPFSRALPLEGCVARDGRVSGKFSVTIPAAGDIVLYPRLVAEEGKLKGPVYAQGWFGELAFPAELAREPS
jgi:CubicO group peptidase (beta-lactamase class C family)